jgi:hypothetical protein
MVQALKVRLSDGRVVNPSDWTSAPLYTTVEIATGALQPLPGFSFGVGGEVPGSPGLRTANHRDTNMQGAGSILAENEELLLFALQIELYQILGSANDQAFMVSPPQDAWAPDAPEVSATNLMAIQRSTLVRLKIANTKDYGVMPISFHGAGMGIHRTTGAMRSSGSAYARGVLLAYNGGVSVGDSREYATPHHVGPGEAFEAALEFPYGQVIEPLSQVAGSTVAANPLNFGTDANARVRATISAIGPRRRPVA